MYGVDTVGIAYKGRIYRSEDSLFLIGVKNNHAWVGLFETYTKRKIAEFEGTYNYRVSFTESKPFGDVDTYQLQSLGEAQGYYPDLELGHGNPVYYTKINDAVLLCIKEAWTPSTPQWETDMTWTLYNGKVIDMRGQLSGQWYEDAFLVSNQGGYDCYSVKKSKQDSYGQCWRHSLVGVLYKPTHENVLSIEGYDTSSYKIPYGYCYAMSLEIEKETAENKEENKYEIYSQPRIVSYFLDASQSWNNGNSGVDTKVVKEIELPDELKKTESGPLRHTLTVLNKDGRKWTFHYERTRFDGSKWETTFTEELPYWND